MRVLVACEFSGVVRDAFAARGHDAWSCDLLPAKGKHIQGDALEAIKGGWDLMVAHPPCTYVCAGSMNWINRQEGRKENAIKAAAFAKALFNAPIPKVAMENPIGLLSRFIRKPNQIIRAYQFGHPYKKDICLWLSGLPELKPTNVLPPPYKTFDFWSTDRYTPEGGSKKSITFQGIADAMAEQWG